MANRNPEDASPRNIPALIEIAKQKLKIPIKKFKDDSSKLDQIRQFIQENNINHHATCLVPAGLIYDKYCKWCNRNNSKAKGIAPFFTKFKLYFNSRILQNKQQYYINPTDFDMSLQNIESTLNDLEKKKIKKKRKI